MNLSINTMELSSAASARATYRPRLMSSAIFSANAYIVLWWKVSDAQMRRNKMTYLWMSGRQ